MPELDFCRLEVTVLHTVQTYKIGSDRAANIDDILRYFDLSNETSWDVENRYFSITEPDVLFQIKFDNTQLNCELKVVDSIEDEGDNFEFKIWNFPENVVMNVGDYLLFKWFWESDPNDITIYHGVIKSAKSKRTTSDLETTIKGELIDQNILYSTTIFDKYPKLTYYSDVKNFVEQELHLQFYSMIPGFSQRKPLPEPIFTRGKSVGVIFENLCQQLTKKVLKDANPRYPKDVARWKFLKEDNHTLLLYRDSDLVNRNSTILNEKMKLTVPEIIYNDVLEFTDNGDGEFTLQVYGLPNVKAGISIHIDATDAPAFVTFDSAYYVVDEVEHNITTTDGYIMKAFVRLSQ